MREEFRQPNEFHMEESLRRESLSQEFHVPFNEYHAPSGEYHVPSDEYHTPSVEFDPTVEESDEPGEERGIGRNGTTKPSGVSLMKKVRKMLYVVSATTFVTVATQAVYPDFVVFSDPFSAGQGWEASAELPSQEEGTVLSPTEEDEGSNATDTRPPSATGPADKESAEAVASSDDGGSSAARIDCPNCEDGVVVCPVCKGDWEYGPVETAEITCEHCENGTHLKRQSIYVYNGTPCKVCNDTGTFLNANGETEECGECRGYASRHQVGEKQIFEYYNEFYRVYAFDASEEYVEEDCPVCGGNGVIIEEVQVPCRECSEGWVTCPDCDGMAGYVED